jgi:antitoxin (DNA-binding transcriptional repressor) of toxin-antitoxin stability system
MKTISLRTLVREPLKVKRMTRAGQSVQVTDNGEPLWILQPANGTDTDEAERRRAIDEILDEVLCEKPSKISAAKLLEESRR